jgi:hypothetical protein
LVERDQSAKNFSDTFGFHIVRFRRIRDDLGQLRAYTIEPA